MFNYLFLAESESLGEVLKKAMFPDNVEVFGISADPTLVTAIIISLALIIFAAAVRIFVIPKFKSVPGRLQMMLEGIVSFFDKIAHEAVHKEAGIMGPYIFTASLYICIGTLAELIGLRPIMSSINTCAAVALMTYTLLIINGIKYRGVVSGLTNALKEFTVPLSMTFRLFGSILSGFLTMEIVYYYMWLSFAVPAVLSVMFTLFHAFIQAYIFAMLSALFVGEATEAPMKDKKKKHNMPGAPSADAAH